jgi:hypothetical protein
MPSRKQRRRRQKERRHDYEYVYVDEEGHELDADVVDVDLARQNGSGAAPPRDRVRAGAPAKRKAKGSGARRTQGREVPPPSWSRVARRAALFAPLMFAFIYLFERNAGMGVVVLNSAMMLTVFLPLSYLMDRMLYRRSLQGGEAGAAKPKRRS